MLACIVGIMPTFDAWTTTSAPNPEALDWHELLPQGEYWRPYDVLYAHFLGCHPQFFPYLNHLFVWAVHLLNCYLTYVIAQQLGYTNRLACIAFAYIYICPAMLGVVLDVDSIHQVAALAWGLLSLFLYLGNMGRWGTWIIPVIIGTLAKESCFAYLLITPFVAWGFKCITVRTFWRHIALAATFGLLYLIARLSLNQGKIASEYIDTDFAQLIKNGGIFILFHLPIIIPSIFCLKRLKERNIIVILCGIFFASILHLCSVYATMHTYVSLPFAAIIFADIISKMRWQKAICIAGVTISLVIDIYLTKTTYDSGKLGLRLARQAIDNTIEPADSVYTISVAAGKRGFSTFIVRDYNAFAWGKFSKFLNNFEWPTTLKDTTLTDYPTKAVLYEIIDKGCSEGFHTFWIIRNDSVEVIRCK